MCVFACIIGDRSAALRRGTTVCGTTAVQPGNFARIAVAFLETSLSVRRGSLTLGHDDRALSSPVPTRRTGERPWPPLRPTRCCGDGGDGPRITPRCRRFGNAGGVPWHPLSRFGTPRLRYGVASRVHHAPTFSRRRALPRASERTRPSEPENRAVFEIDTTLSQEWSRNSIRGPQCAFEMSMFMCPAVHKLTRN